MPLIAKVLLYKRGQYVFAFNFHPLMDWEITIPEVFDRMYQKYLFTDAVIYGGNDSASPEPALNESENFRAAELLFGVGKSKRENSCEIPASVIKMLPRGNLT